MKRLAWIALLSSTAILRTIATGQSGQSSAAAEGSIRWYAERAKHNGETSVIIPAPMGMSEEITTLDQALSTYRVVIATPINSLTDIGEFHIGTWYKLRILQSLIDHPNPEVEAAAIPTSLKPVKPNEIVIYTHQGTTTIDDVQVNVVDRTCHPLIRAKKYLMFFSPDRSGQFAYRRCGVNAIYVLTAANKVIPLVPDTRSLLQEDLADSTSGGMLDKLKSLAAAKVVSQSSN